jgi:hypothetical protein
MDARFTRRPNPDDTQPVVPLVWEHRRKSQPTLISGYTPKPAQNINRGWIWAALGLATLILSSHIRSVAIAIQLGCAAIGCICILGIAMLLMLFAVISLIR